MKKTYKALALLSVLLLTGLVGIIDARGGGGRGGGGHYRGGGRGGYRDGGRGYRGGYRRGGYRGGYWRGGKWIVPAAIIGAEVGATRVLVPGYYDADGYWVPEHYEWR